jgi:hypothetical protein
MFLTDDSTSSSEVSSFLIPPLTAVAMMELLAVTSELVKATFANAASSSMSSSSLSLV